jgi:hypothetical protein
MPDEEQWTPVVRRQRKVLVREESKEDEGYPMTEKELRAYRKYLMESAMEMKLDLNNEKHRELIRQRGCDPRDYED